MKKNAKTSSVVSLTAIDELKKRIYEGEQEKQRIRSLRRR
jgi:hypothetical protein